MNIKQFLHTKEGIKKTRGGFTLIEILISITIFAIVMVVAVGALVTIIDANRKSHSTQLAVNNVNAAVDHMSWQIRNGSNYYCIDEDGNDFSDPEDCNVSAGMSGFGFTASDGSSYRYELTDDGRIQRTIDDDGDVTVADITSSSDEVTITALNFSLLGGEGETQPAVTITVQGEAGINDKTGSDFNIQTTVSERFTLTYDAGGGVASELESCPYVPAPGRYIVDFVELREDDSVVVQSRTWEGAETRQPEPGDPPHSLGFTLPAGQYNVSITTFEAHDSGPTQRAETVYLGLTDGGGVDTEPFAYTGVSPELVGNPDEESDEGLRLDLALETWGPVSAGEGIAATMVNPHYMKKNYDDFLNMGNDTPFPAYPDTPLTLTQDATHFYIYHGHPQARKVSGTIYYAEALGQNLPAYTCPGIEDFEAFCDPANFPRPYFYSSTANDRLSESDCVDVLNAGFCPARYNAGDGIGSTAHSLVFMCAAFDSLDVGGELEIEDF